MEALHNWLPTIFAFMRESRMLGALIIMASALVVAKMVDLFVDRVLLAIAHRTKFRLDEEILEVLHRPIWVSIVLAGAMSAVRWIAPAPPFTFILAGLLETALVVVWGLAFDRILHRIGADWIDHLRRSGRQGAEIIRLGENVARLLVFAGVVFFFLSLWKINVTPLLASAGIAGVAVALAAKEMLANFFGGVSVFLDQPFRTGDYIVLDSGERGEVVTVGLRSTRILTRDDVQISIPNSIIANTKIINESAPEPRFRVRIGVSVAYGSDVDQVEEVLLSAARNNSLVAPEPEPRVRFRTFGESSLDFELLCWAQAPKDKGLLIHELNREIYKAFGRAGIVIPFPQRDVHMYSHGAERKVPMRNSEGGTGNLPNAERGMRNGE
jgi:MscS family membrane protein